MLQFDARYYKYEFISGIDEAGRGPLAGPLVVAGVTVKNDFSLQGLNDSKKLSDKKRRELFAVIPSLVTAYSIVIIEPAEIDQLNILQATLAGMTRVWKNLEKKGHLLIDGNRIPSELASTDSEAVIKGDQLVSAIAAASILAKVTRDDIMLKYHKLYPGYDFASNKGYGTAHHLAAIQDLGITPIHRHSYGPVNQYTIKFE